MVDAPSTVGEGNNPASDLKAFLERKLLGGEKKEFPLDLEVRGGVSRTARKREASQAARGKKLIDDWATSDRKVVGQPLPLLRGRS